MHCEKCGAPVVAGAAFCQKCGHQLGAAAAQDLSPAERAGLAPRASRDVPEEVLWQGGYSPKAMLGTWIFAAVVSLALVAVAMALPAWSWAALSLLAALWIGLGLNLLYKRFAIRYRLTNQRFFHEHGVLQRVTNRIEVIDIDDLELTQGIVERMLGVGRIRILSHDVNDAKLVVDGIDNVQKVFSLLDSARRAERMRRGVSVEQV